MLKKETWIIHFILAKYQVARVCSLLQINKFTLLYFRYSVWRLDSCTVGHPDFMCASIDSCLCNSHHLCQEKVQVSLNYHLQCTHSSVTTIKAKIYLLFTTFSL